MKHTRQLALLTLSAGLLSACSTPMRNAPVIDRVTPPPAAAKPLAPSSSPAPAQEAPKPDAPGMYTVKKGDTLLRIALDHGQNYKDLAAWNNLANPDDIKVDQVLRVSPPEGGLQSLPVAPPPIVDSRPAVPRKTAPKADKKPYSDAALAEAQKGEGGAARAQETTPAPSVAPTPAPTPSLPPLAPDEANLSWSWPADGRIVATFDEGKNKGIDIAGKPGQQVLAAGAGKVMYAGSGIRGYGNLVIVKHSNNLLSAYAHNRAILVKEGQSVAKGQLIAEMGDSDTDAVKLHFEIRQQGKPVDPSKFLPPR
ncbi:peptidoglycan DD-metalloendopeptidase family protein [Massilia sp. TS11]|uniref:peptidoglycan DD-metalloendopeptidase family protein n=1 Tax=Massilia sp. TS11 TaxID=2908003 RepID=UPI001EDA1E1A|nr:peptidoglycan DD-metalloendopeptidase family protein [Massilia sp. TS11]MCG2583127.1 peptidoglycan DD-metalloendopeptidase family protein [Massilia sp. TS11]